MLAGSRGRDILFAARALPLFCRIAPALLPEAELIWRRRVRRLRRELLLVLPLLVTLLFVVFPLGILIV